MAGRKLEQWLFRSARASRSIESSQEGIWPSRGILLDVSLHLPEYRRTYKDFH